MDAAIADLNNFKHLATLLFATSFLFLNVDGYCPLGMEYPLKSAPDLDTFFSEPPGSSYKELSLHVQRAVGRAEPKTKGRSWVHGWPFIFVGRSPTYSKSAGIDVNTTSMLAGDMAYTSRWPIDGAYIFYFSYLTLLINISFGLILAFAVWWTTPAKPIRFRLSHMLIAVAITAMLIRFKLLNLRFTPQIMSLTVVAFCLVLPVAVAAHRIKRRFYDEE